MSPATIRSHSDYSIEPRLLSPEHALDLDALIHTGPLDRTRWAIEDDQGTHIDETEHALSPLLQSVHWEAISSVEVAATTSTGYSNDGFLAVEFKPWHTRFFWQSPASLREPIEHLCDELTLFLDALPLRPIDIATAASEETPSSLFDQLITDGELSAAVKKLFIDGHYAQAVEAAFKCLNNLVKSRSGLSDCDGEPLMQRAFSEKTPVLALNSLKTPSHRNQQVGYMLLFAGAMRGIRNPRAHQHDLRDEPRIAFELLVFANHLFRVARQSKRRRKLFQLPRRTK